MPEVKKLKNDLGEEFELLFKDVALGVNALGGEILLPKDMELSEAVWWLRLKEKELETVVQVNEIIDGYPIDVAHAMQLAVSEMFGIRELRSTPDLWGEKPPNFMSVPINVANDMVEVFLGRFGLPGVDGFIESSRVFNDALILAIRVKQKSLPQVRRMIELTRKKLIAHSLYKGKAFRVKMEKESNGFEEKLTMANPEFIDVTKLPAQLVLNRDTRDLLTAALWVPLERTEQTRYCGVSLKRGILLFGPYGTGKSLTALETAKIAQENGWTFIYLTNVRDLKRVYQFAVRYSPSVVFAEDIDVIVDDEEGVKMLNNVLDGVDSKSSEVILVLTTNHVEKLPQSLLRAGRFDSVVKYSRPDPQATKELVLQYAGNHIDLDNFDGDRVGEILKGNQPSTIHEVVKRAKLFAQLRYPRDYRGPLKLSTRDLELSNTSMQTHLDLLNKPPEATKSAIELFGNIVGNYLVAGVNTAAAQHLPSLSHDFEPSIVEK